MPRRLRPLAPNTVYHVIVKGNGGAALFLDDADCRDFLMLLSREIGRRGWRMLAWCLLGNHAHLVVETPRPDLSGGMQRVCGVYAQRSHRRRATYGHVFNDRFHAYVIDDDVYLMAAVRYVVRNPVAAELCRTVRDWRWSSHAAMAGGYEDGVTTTDRVDALFGAWAGDGRRRYLAWTEEGAAELPPPLEALSFAPPTIEELIAAHGLADGSRRAVADGHSMRAIARATNTSATTISRLLRGQTL